MNEYCYILKYQDPEDGIWHFLERLQPERVQKGTKEHKGWFFTCEVPYYEWSSDSVLRKTARDHAENYMQQYKKVAIYHAEWWNGRWAFEEKVWQNGEWI